MKLATRASALAWAQSGHVADAIHRVTGRTVERIPVKTRGDQIVDRPLRDLGGKGLFTKEIEEALLDGRADFAVHSLKDLPVGHVPGLVVAAIPLREDARDVVIGRPLGELEPGARVGTGSLRRRCQLLALRPDLSIEELRGNVDTRIGRVREGAYEAVVLAAAGLARLGRLDDVAEYLDLDAMVPAVGQGALAVQCRADDTETLACLARIHDERTALAVGIERAFLAAVDGSCHVPVAAHARWDGDMLVATALNGADGVIRRASGRVDPLHGVALGRDLARRVLG